MRGKGGARLVHEDESGRPWSRTHARAGWREQELAIVEVPNATPESDGSLRTCFLRLPPELRAARAAVAWTFGLTVDRYAPVQET